MFKELGDVGSGDNSHSKKNGRGIFEKVKDAFDV